MRPERLHHNGHRIELRVAGTELVLSIDDETISYGQLPDGRYFLHQYAYDWRDDLMDLARAFVDYQRTSDRVRRDRARSSGG
ncbi:twin-arginine translocation pathway signal protein [Streptomyces sp. CBMA152]|uniref:twin-arginine translocation pathway signal protein n=1 Tax=Streptomyces sp. CBMA152 TaxID=1896312 RepID=UPI001660EE1A|nr:twin-arginine translocation pathway signal protein [Streptomyces sp. CBMA152]MBD0742407.1 hypothetical protein [Streptomyces sp. CBMA152]